MYNENISKNDYYAIANIAKFPFAGGHVKLSTQAKLFFHKKAIICCSCNVRYI